MCVIVCVQVGVHACVHDYMRAGVCVIVCVQVGVCACMIVCVQMGVRV